MDLAAIDPAASYAVILAGHVGIFAPALDDDDGIVGGVLAVFQGNSEVLEDADPLFADTENVASAYARLLVDLLGESGRLISRSDEAEGGQ